MTPVEQAFLERARVGTLATVDGEGRPHAVPVCYAVVDAPGNEGERGDAGESGIEDDAPRLVSAIDEKPKSTRDLRRVRNIRENPQVTLLVHRYEADWSRLAWLQARGRARIVAPDETGHGAAVTALESKYDQYADHDLRERRVLEIDVDRTRSWGALEARS